MEARKASTSIPDHVYSRLEQEAQKTGRSISAVIADRVEKSFALDALTKEEFAQFANFNIAIFTELFALLNKTLPESEKVNPVHLIKRILIQCKTNKE